MHPLLPEPKEIRIYQQLGRITSKQLEPMDQLLLILPKRVPASLWKQLPGGLKLKAAMRRRGSAAMPALYARLGNKKQTLVSGATLAADAPAFEQLTLARRLVASRSRRELYNLICTESSRRSG